MPRRGSSKAQRGKLAKHELEVMELYYTKDKNMTEIAKMFNCKPQAVSSLINKVDKLIEKHYLARPKQVQEKKMKAIDTIEKRAKLLNLIEVAKLSAIVDKINKWKGKKIQDREKLSLEEHEILDKAIYLQNSLMTAIDNANKFVFMLNIIREQSRLLGR